MCIALINRPEASYTYTSHLSHIISVLVIPNEFPTLLAKREIIANALFFKNVTEYGLHQNSAATKIHHFFGNNKNTAIHSAFQKNMCKFARHFHNGNTTSHEEMECGKRHITDI